MICPICGRQMIVGPSINDHHLIPKTFGGKELITMHRICHSKIHSVISERDLLKYYNTVDKILEHEEIQKFVKWVGNKSPEFYVSHDETKDKKVKRKK